MECGLCFLLMFGVILQYIPRNMHTVFALLCFVVVIHWLIFPYPSGLLHWHCGNLTIAPVPAKQPWWIWINTSCEFIMKDCITTTKQSTTKLCAYFLGYTVLSLLLSNTMFVFIFLQHCLMMVYFLATLLDDGVRMMWLNPTLGYSPLHYNIRSNLTLKHFSTLLLSFIKLDSTRHKASEICLRPPLDIYSHMFSR